MTDAEELAKALGREAAQRGLKRYQAKEFFDAIYRAHALARAGGHQGKAAAMAGVRREYFAPHHRARGKGKDHE